MVPSLIISPLLATQSQLDELDLSAAMADLDQSKSDRAGLESIGIELGMAMMDAMEASGFYTEMLTAAVGSDGRTVAYP